MKIKKVITSGCSFSDPFTPYSWVNMLENYTQLIDGNVKFDHRGLGSQGQELIQKKAFHAIVEALDEGYKPEEIAVIVMWSGTDRKAFYIDNYTLINEIVEGWKNSHQGWQLQFFDLKNNMEARNQIVTKATINNRISFNPHGGWFITNGSVRDGVKFLTEFFMMAKDSPGVAPTHTSIENIIMLQSFCKLKGIQLYQQFYSTHTLGDIERYKDHQIIEYLYKQLDEKSIVSRTSMYDYLAHDVNNFKSNTDHHPGGLGHKIWTHEVLIPHLKQKGFFNESTRNSPV